MARKQRPQTLADIAKLVPRSLDPEGKQPAPARRVIVQLRQRAEAAEASVAEMLWLDEAVCECLGDPPEDCDCGGCQEASARLKAGTQRSNLKVSPKQPDHVGIAIALYDLLPGLDNWQHASVGSARRDARDALLSAIDAFEAIESSEPEISEVHRK